MNYKKSLFTTILFLGLVYILGWISQATAQTWTQLTTTGSAPTARYRPTAVYDSVNNRMTIFGGYDGSYLNDVWVLTNANGLGETPTWTQLISNGNTPSAPTMRGAHTTVYDAANNRMTIFGGYNVGNYLSDVWVLSNANGLGGTSVWTQLTTTGGPPLGREFHTAVYDNANNRMTIFGGEYSGGNLNDVWVLSNANGLGGTPVWTQLSPTGSPPLVRFGHTAVYDNINNRMTIFGGEDGGSNYFNDVWVLSNTNGLGGTPAWTQLSQTGSSPSERDRHTAFYDAANNRMTIFWGWNGGGIENDVRMLSNANGLGGTPAWTQLISTGITPTTRFGHTAVFDTINNQMTIFGGSDNFNFLNDVWVLSLGLPEIPITGDIIYHYDNTYRLVTCSFTNGVSIVYSYDSSGNRLGKSVTSKLLLSLGSNNPFPVTIPADTTDRCLLQLHLQASNDEYIQLTTVRVTAIGTGNDYSDILGIKMYKDNDGNGYYSGGDIQLGNTTTFNSDNGSATFTGFSQNISSGSGIDIIFIATIVGTGNPSETYGLKLAKNTDIGAIGLSSNQSIYPLGAPITGQSNAVVHVELSQFEIAWTIP